MSGKSIIGKIKSYLQLLGVNVRAFAKHPKEYTKNFIKEFKEADLKGRILKIVKLIISIYIIIELFWLAVACILLMAVFMGGDDDYNELVRRFIERHGREPENSYEVYHDV